MRHREPRPSTWSGRFKAFRWDYVLGKALHLFKLGAALQQEKVNANRFKLGNAFRNLAGCADKSGSQSSITNGVIFEGNMLIELCPGQPLLVIVVTGSGLFHVGNACQLSLRLLFGITNNRVGGHAEGHRTEPFLFSSLGHVSDLGTDTIGRISMHNKGIAAFTDQFFRRFRFATGVNQWSWL